MYMSVNKPYYNYTSVNIPCLLHVHHVHVYVQKQQGLSQRHIFKQHSSYNTSVRGRGKLVLASPASTKKIFPIDTRTTHTVATTPDIRGREREVSLAAPDLH